ncbi:MAG: Hsp33 family molecular chaperone [Hyphomicrobiales bacterium]|nr:Hsp33 family molecular chaperone [Hyphomicrobiales bacterium]
MAQPEKAKESSAPAPDDLIHPFQTDNAGASGRVVRLGAVIDEILGHHDYPDVVSALLGEAVALAALVGAALKFDGTFILQTKTDGPVDMLVADYTAPGQLRGHASFDRARVDRLEAAAAQELLGNGHLAMTIDQGADMERYQGVVPLEGCDLNAAADIYFRQSVQLDTFLRVAVARHYTAPTNGGAGNWQWRAGGLMLQNLTREGGRSGIFADLDAGAGADGDAEDWNRVRLLAETVEDQELVDPMLSSERLLYRLFHEEAVRAYTPSALSFECRCSRDKVKAMLDQFSPSDLREMVEEGEIRVTCEFCNRQYSFDPSAYG